MDVTESQTAPRIDLSPTTTTELGNAPEEVGDTSLEHVPEKRFVTRHYDPLTGIDWQNVIEWWPTETAPPGSVPDVDEDEGDHPTGYSLYLYSVRLSDMAVFPPIMVSSDPSHSDPAPSDPSPLAE